MRAIEQHRLFSDSAIEHVGGARIVHAAPWAHAREQLGPSPHPSSHYSFNASTHFLSLLFHCQAGRLGTQIELET